ncbi:phosphate ABC transporter permease PstA [Duganella sp. FT3S]|uniref:Phosphate transport system permease protein PstA n=1 Tax=Rugamonas fusca TaxID=2758568 RepID=A0A7W2I593_9BURK|nr:phosphate ABC transporter permease PstA [Rugamonas fusca]MBA5604191.1 phosphate ABC transporter permease PstA [Rugamonas fusca]
MSERLRNALFGGLVWSAALLMLTTFVWLLGDLIIGGLGHLSWTFVSTPPSDAGRAGGIAPILVSTLLILAVALAAALPLGIGCAIWLAEYTRRQGRAGALIRLSLDGLAGVPSIVFGLFGNAFFCVTLKLGFSILSGGLTLACMILPILVRTTESGLAAVGGDWRRGAAALGMSRTATLWHLLLPAAAPAIGAGLTLGIGRATAETAALIFTSGYVDRMPEALTDSGRALAVHIYDLAMNVGGGDAAAYASALVLVALIALTNFAALGATERWLGKRIGSS